MIVISGPSTVGKNPFIYRACSLYDLKFVTPCTTRARRSEEINGNDYFFLSKTEFQSKIQSKEIVEWDYCLENYYGYLFNFLYNGCCITHGLSRLALRIKNKYPNKIFKNLKKIYSGKSLLLRESLVEEELCHAVLFDKIFTCSESVFDLFNEKEMQQLLLVEKAMISS